MFEVASVEADAGSRCDTRALKGRIAAAARAEARAAAERLIAIGELFVARLREFGETEDWAIDTTEAVACEVAAELRISQALAASTLDYARALRERLPQVGAVFAAGDLDFATFRTLVYRTDLITDRDALVAVDAELAVAVPRWSSMSRGRMAAAVDRIVARRDPDAMRRRREKAAEREIWINERLDGLADIGGTVLSVYARALDERLTAMAATVCERDPRTRDQRRADALGALVVRADRIACRCEQRDCAAAGKPAASPVVIHVFAEQATVERRGEVPGTLVESDGLIPPELVAELAASAKLRPLIHPADAAPESGYVPSRALADYVRCRDLTCRFPGCDRPAVRCDLDHTTPYGDGGTTQAANLKCLCRLHHLLKTFCGWRDRQLRDGTVIWSSPSGDTYITTPGSALLFPELCAPTAPAVALNVAEHRRAPRTTMMPRRVRTRAQNRAARIAAERRENRLARQTGRDRERQSRVDCFADRPPPDGADPPPF
ncbi:MULTISPECIES: HNH endonuclease signature motif containing protein [unclassified Mycolicibacterium]|uniref:HNH endonuclease signature motif containing protein n=1 Tax=unclassified Mycolicibacterium TaxID=2636767 RepID=UPI0012DF71EA|nr:MULTISPECIES: HNH endonuclease signature motif containing protein [unclassified Mycolicibacterium]MUL81945.1 HNH endonuclease [Mycolicibacterium sp. CBMA 329]MUL87711.1 HNH endonuclease [Mycolicibacterium sp. CBMA 331]MUL99426.1 HNH endonuclease [Mycolicibacterium sp. CBMA 334]MUM29436.1 HNH endonuclease [Mycolicibacterium sp. CBMA 295]MUM38008.1 HNH endonuclease [Mycolicibacterium sp. CBMA 247]